MPATRPVREVDFGRLSVRPSRLDDAVYWIFRTFVRLFFRICFRMRIEGAPPKTGAYVLVANHASFLDPLILGAAPNRRAIFLMTETVWRSKSTHWFYRWMRSIPLSTRGGNREALRAARAVLGQERVIAIFPEGGLSRDGKLMLGSPGAVSLVLNEGLPIVPVGIVGANDILPAGGKLRFRKLTVRFGEPITKDDVAALGDDRRTRLRETTRLIMQRIAKLIGQTAREDVLEEARNGQQGQQPVAVDS